MAEHPEQKAYRLRAHAREAEETVRMLRVLLGKAMREELDAKAAARDAEMAVNRKTA